MPLEKGKKYKDIYHKDIYHKNIYHKDTYHKDTYHKDTYHKDTYHKDTYHRKNFKYIKKYDNGKHADFVLLLKHKDNGKLVIKKKYKKKHSEIYHNEIDILKKLKGCSFVPKILKDNPETLTFYMTYCGEPIPNLIDYKKTIEEYNKTLKDKFQIYHNDIKPGNVCKFGKRIYFIDFGWASDRKLKAGYGKGKAGYGKSELNNKIFESKEDDKTFEEDKEKETIEN